MPGLPFIDQKKEDKDFSDDFVKSVIVHGLGYI